MDLEERRELIYEAQEIFTEELPYVTLYRKLAMYGINNRVKGWIIDPNQGYLSPDSLQWMYFE